MAIGATLPAPMAGCDKEPLSVLRCRELLGLGDTQHLTDEQVSAVRDQLYLLARAAVACGPGNRDALSQQRALISRALGAALAAAWGRTHARLDREQEPTPTRTMTRSAKAQCEPATVHTQTQTIQRHQARTRALIRDVRRRSDAPTHWSLLIAASCRDVGYLGPTATKNTRVKNARMVAIATLNLNGIVILLAAVRFGHTQVVPVHVPMRGDSDCIRSQS